MKKTSFCNRKLLKKSKIDQKTIFKSVHPRFLCFLQKNSKNLDENNRKYRPSRSRAKMLRGQEYHPRQHIGESQRECQRPPQANRVGAVTRSC